MDVECALVFGLVCSAAQETPNLGRGRCGFGQINLSEQLTAMLMYINQVGLIRAKLIGSVKISAKN